MNWPILLMKLGITFIHWQCCQMKHFLAKKNFSYTWGSNSFEYFQEIKIDDRPLVLDTVSVSDTFKMYQYRHIDTFFINVLKKYQYIFSCQYFFQYFSSSFWPIFDQNSIQFQFFVESNCILGPLCLRISFTKSFVVEIT